MKTVPKNSDSGLYLTLIAVHGRCRCDLATRVCLDDLPGCPLCALLDPEWLCPAGPEADYPDPDLVTIEIPPDPERSDIAPPRKTRRS